MKMNNIFIRLILLFVTFEFCAGSSLAQRFCDFTDDRVSEEQPTTQNERFQTFGYDATISLLTFEVSPSEYMCGKR
jgi:hypothetical protein